MFHTYCYPDAALNEKAECPVPSKPFRLPPLASDRSGAARPAKAALEEPIVGLSARRFGRRRGAGGRGGKGGLAWLAGKWRRKGLKRFNSRRELVWPGQPRSHNIWYWGERGSSSRRIPAASRRMAEATSDLRGAHVSAGSPQVGQKLHDMAPKTLKSLARLSTLHVWLDEMETHPHQRRFPCLRPVPTSESQASRSVVYPERGSAPTFRNWRS